MRRMLIMILAVSMVAMMAFPAFAEVQNIKVTGSITVRGFMRDNYGTTGSGGGAAITPNADDQIFADTGTTDWYNTQTRIGISADLTDNVGATVILGNERDWGTGTAESATTDGETFKVRSAYMTMQEMLYSPLTVKIGRMPVKVADGLIIGDAVTNETIMASDYADTKEWDAIMGTLDYDPLTLHIGTAKLTEALQIATDDVDVYVIDGIYKFEDDYDTVLDAYYCRAHYSSPGITGTTGPDGWAGATPTAGTSTQGVDVDILAAVATFTPLDRLNAKVGFAIEKGDYIKNATTKRDVDAIAYDIAVTYALDMEQVNDYSPVVGLKYVYRSGPDANNTTGDYEGWLPMTEDQTNGIIGDPNTNISAIAITGTAVPADRVTAGVEYWIYTLAENETAVAGVNSTDDEIGTELDLRANYAYTEDVNIGASLAWFWPGDYYVTGNNKTAMQAMVEVGVKF